MARASAPEFFEEPNIINVEFSRPSRAEKRKAKKIIKESKQFKRHPAPLTPKTQAQAEFIEALSESKVLLVCGGAGVGKTYVAARYGMQKLLDGTYDRIIVTRPMVAVSGENLGFLPGDVKAKCEPWAIPVMDSFRDGVGSKEELDRMVREGRIEFAPFANIRGRTFNNSFILADESQNLTVEQFKVLITRVGEDSQIVVDGDLRQSDIKGNNGLKYAIHIAEKYGLNCEVFEFEDSDVVRSAVVAEWVRAFSAHEKDT